MKSLQLTDLKKNETLPNSYQVSLAYKGRKVDLILDNYAYSLQQLLETANNLLISLPDMDSKARRYLAQENIECFNTCREQQQKPTVSVEYLEQAMQLSAVQLFDESIDFYYHLNCDKDYQLIVEVDLLRGYKNPTFRQWFADAQVENKYLKKVTSFLKKVFKGK